MNDPKNTTLYNHKKAGLKPVIPNIEYKQLLEAIDRGEVERYQECINEYSLTFEQELWAKDKINKAKAKK